MDEEFLTMLQSGSADEALTALKQFNSQNAGVFEFPLFTSDTKQHVYEALFDRLNDAPAGRLHAECLVCIRILSREKSGLEVASSERALNTLLCFAGLGPFSEEYEQPLVTIQDTTLVIEAQKCLCNILFNSAVAQRLCGSNSCIEGIVHRLKTYKDPMLIHEIKYFDMRLLFVLTALVQDIRPKLRQTLHGFTYLIEVLDLTLRSAEETGRSLSDEEVDLSCEVLKILFNLTNGVDSVGLDEEEEAHFMRLVSVLHDLLVSQTGSNEKRDLLRSNAVNLLTQMPKESYEELLTPINEVSELTECNPLEYDGKSMEAILSLLDFLDRRLDTPQQSLKDSLAPILHCLCLICRSNRCIRTFCRLKVLPYLRDEVKMLPEDGQTLRNKLCKLFTNSSTEVKTLAADFIFVLCKENVGRFIKYTGFGNAAGLLAQRGLLCGGPSKVVYSSESEDSETEEYGQLKEGVNPVTGRWEEDKPSPMEGMTEEQKEYEAMQLVNKMDQLQRAGVIQPSRISEEGRPVPVEHVLELLEGMNVAPPTTDHNSDSE